MKLGTVVNVVLAIAAVGMVGLVARRELAPVPAPTGRMRILAEEDWARVRTAARLLKGPEDAVVQIVEFGDYQCGACAVAHDELTALVQRHPGIVAVRFRHYPLRRLHAYALPAAIAAECAAREGAFGSFHESVFANQANLGSWSWEAFAKAAGIEDTERFNGCVGDEDATAVAAVARDTMAAYHIGVRVTPSFVINGNVLAASPSAQRWDVLVRHFATRERTLNGGG